MALIEILAALFTTEANQTPLMMVNDAITGLQAGIDFATKIMDTSANVDEIEEQLYYMDCIKQTWKQVREKYPVDLPEADKFEKEMEEKIDEYSGYFGTAMINDLLTKIYPAHDMMSILMKLNHFPQFNTLIVLVKDIAVAIRRKDRPLISFVREIAPIRAEITESNIHKNKEIILDLIESILSHIRRETI